MWTRGPLNRMWFSTGPQPRRQRCGRCERGDPHASRCSRTSHGPPRHLHLHVKKPISNYFQLTVHAIANIAVITYRHNQYPPRGNQ